MYALQVNDELYGESRDKLMERLAVNKIQTRPVWYPNHIQKPYLNEFNYKIENALFLYTSTINIPCSVNLSSDDINNVIGALTNE